MWSLVTETKVGEDNRTEATPLTIDPQYTVGFSWARQYAFRVVKNFNNKTWFGFSVENSQETLTAHGNTANSFLSVHRAIAAVCITPPSTAASSGTRSAASRRPAQSANYSFNPSPDFVVKAGVSAGLRTL